MTAGGLAMSVRSRNRHQETRNEEVNHDDQNRRSDHRLSGSAPHALSSAACCHAVETSCGGNDEPEEQQLCQTHEDILEDEDLPRGAPVLARVNAKEDFGGYAAASDAGEIGDDGEEEHHHRGGEDTGSNKVF